MNKTTNRKLFSVFLVILLSTIVAPFALLPEAAAQTTTRSFIYVGASPNVVGVGQTMIIVTWTADIPPDIGETNLLVTSPTGRAGWDAEYVNIVKPDGTNETITMPRSDPIGATWANYVPDATGTYMIQAHFPAQWKNSTTSTSRIYFTEDWSAPANFTVQQDPTPTWIETPLTEDYWNRPLNSANHEWYVLAGGWLGGAAQNYPQGTAGLTSNYVNGNAPESSHILWTKQLYVGGLMDESYEAIGYQTQHYQGIGLSGLILNGQFHYTPRLNAQGAQGWEIVDLYTGEQLMLDWNATRPSQAQIYNYESPNQHGGFSYLWRTSNVQLPPQVTVANAQQFPNMSVVQLSPSQTVFKENVTTGNLYEMLDGYTGKTVFYIANVSTTGTQVYGKDGSILRYALTNYGNSTNPAYKLSVWNSSAGTMVASQLGTGYWQWRPAAGQFGAGSGAYFSSSSAIYNCVHDGRTFYSLNASIPSPFGTRNSVSNQTASIYVIKQDEYMVLAAGGTNNGTTSAPAIVIKVSLKPGEVGTQLSRVEFTPPSNEGGTEAVSLTGVYPEEGMVLFHKTKTMERFGYSMETGSLVWKSDPEVQFQYYGISQNYYNGTLLSYGYGGQLVCYDIKTGNVNWRYDPTTIGTESAYGGNYPLGVAIISDGKLYTITGEHSPTQPLMRGPNLRCIDATTGQEIWKILGFFGGMSPTSSNIFMSDGILVGLNHFDNQIYGFGRGPSGTTVSAPQTVPALGASVTITGTVTDRSPAGKRNVNDVLEKSLKETPAISDADMSAWMEYMFMQQAKPTNAKGVPVTLTAIDPNGNLVPIGETTSDMNGNYGIAYAPEVPGTYQIIANFAGSKAYGPSSASTYLAVGEAAAVIPTPSPAPLSLADQYFIPAIVGVILAIAIVGALVILLLLRKRP